MYVDFLLFIMIYDLYFLFYFFQMRICSTSDGRCSFLAAGGDTASRCDAHYLFISFQSLAYCWPEFISRRAGIGCGGHPMGVTQSPSVESQGGGNNSPESPCVESGLFLVGSASPAISVSRRRRRLQRRCQGTDYFFSATHLPKVSVTRM